MPVLNANICGIVFCKSYMHLYFVLTRQWKCCAKLTQLFLFQFLIYAHFINILCLRLTDEKGKGTMVAPPFPLLPCHHFRKKWLANTRMSKECDRFPWSLVLPRTPLPSLSVKMFWFWRRVRPLGAVSAPSLGRRHWCAYPASELHSRWVGWSSSARVGRQGS